MFVIQQGKEKSMGRKSTRENKTIYQQLREEDNLPREKASELLAFISEDRLERIENEKVQPAPRGRDPHVPGLQCPGALQLLLLT